MQFTWTRQRKNLGVVLLACLAGPPVGTAEEQGLVGHWDCDEGAGTTLHDRSGRANHGSIHGAEWVTCGAGFALRFDGMDDYVDCGDGPGLDIRGPITLCAWVRPVIAGTDEPGVVGKYFDSFALTLYRSGCWWYISSGGNNVSAPLKTGQWHHVAGTFDGRKMKLYVNGAERACKDSEYQSIHPGKAFLMGHIVPDPAAPDAAKHIRGHFQGLLDEVKLYNRVLSSAEVIAEYNRQAEPKGCKPVDIPSSGRLRLKHHHYFEQKRLVIEVGYGGLLPVPSGAEISVELRRPDGDSPIARQKVQPAPNRTSSEVTFSLDGLPQGQYEVKVLCRAVSGQDVESRLTVAHVEPVCTVPDPNQQTASPLPPAKPPVSYAFSLKPGGGFVVSVKGKEYPVESSYSFPHGGENRLTARNDPHAGGEPAWQVRTHKQDDKCYRVAAGGTYYSIDREITLHPDRIVIKDNITNRQQEVLGIILSNHVDTSGKDISSVELATASTLFVSCPDHGLGMIALDDIYQLQQKTRYHNNTAAMVTDKFGLDKGASYVIEWAVYPTATGDWFDFVNAYRSVEGLNRTVEGAFYLVGDGEGLVGPEDRRTPPGPDVIQAKGVKYVSYFYLIAPADDPGMSLEGIEFTEYPKESALLKHVVAETHRLNPGIKVMFHIAHGLYATNAPDKLFPDSRALDANGRQIMYGSNSASYYCQYFSKERFDQGHRWWIFYPTLENSFGKAMLKAIDYMLDYIGTSGMYADGFVGGYAGDGYTYDTWDGHSVEIDPQTKTVRRKMGNVTYLSLPVLKAVARKVAAKGGVLITNGQSGPRSLWKENYITTSETTGGDQLPICSQYAGPAVTAFGDPARIKTRLDLYQDILAKLDWGALYFYYGDKNLGVEERTIAAHMYPFTLEELHAGWMKGRERIITKVSGTYGWRGDRRLHRVVRSDDRGILVPNLGFSTADASEVRTELHLGESESAVVTTIPVAVETSRPVNVLVTDYGKDGMKLQFAGKGEVRLVLTDGELAVRPDRTYTCIGQKRDLVKADAAGSVIIPLNLDGKACVQVVPSGP